MKQGINYEEDIKLDVDALDLEWEEQPELMIKYIRHSAKARQEMDNAKQTLDIVRAEVDSRIRKDPDEYDIKKVTDAVVAATVLTQEEYKVAFENYLEAKYESDMAQGAVRAFEARKDALENLVRLHGQGYFAGPKVPRILQDERRKKEEAEKETSAGISSHLNKRRRTK